MAFTNISEPSGTFATIFDPATAVHATFALRVDRDWFRVTVAGDSIDIARGRSERPAVTFDTDAATLRSVAFGREPISDAERDGRLTVDGDRLLAERFRADVPLRQLPAITVNRQRMTPGACENDISSPECNRRGPSTCADRGRGGHHRTT